MQTCIKPACLLAFWPHQQRRVGRVIHPFRTPRQPTAYKLTNIRYACRALILPVSCRLINVVRDSLDKAERHTALHKSLALIALLAVSPLLPTYGDLYVGSIHTYVHTYIPCLFQAALIPTESYFQQSATRRELNLQAIHDLSPI